MGKLLVFVSPHGEFFNVKTDYPREEQKSFDRFGVLLENAKTIPSSEGSPISNLAGFAVGKAEVT